MFMSVKRLFRDGLPVGETSGPDHPTVYGELLIKRGVAVLYEPMRPDTPLLRLRVISWTMQNWSIELAGLELRAGRRKREYQEWHCEPQDWTEWREAPRPPEALIRELQGLKPIRTTPAATGQREHE